MLWLTVWPDGGHACPHIADGKGRGDHSYGGLFYGQGLFIHRQGTHHNGDLTIHCGSRSNLNQNTKDVFLQCLVLLSLKLQHKIDFLSWSIRPENRSTCSTIIYFYWAYLYLKETNKMRKILSYTLKEKLELFLLYVSPWIFNQYPLWK